MILFSIAVAVYNVAQYLRPCVDSICKQLADDVELLLIDDGSTDCSGKICDEYALKDDRIRVIHQTNSGLSIVRNVSIQQAKGKWIIFVDGDDVLTDDALLIMRNYADREDELIVFESGRFTDEFLPLPMSASGEERCLSQEEIKDYRLGLLDGKRKNRLPHTLYRPSVWGKMWNLSYLQNSGIWFRRELKSAQDVQYCFAITREMKRICIVDRCVYGYRINPESITLRFSEDAPDYHSRLLNSIKDDMKKHGELNSKIFSEACVEGSVLYFEASMIRSFQHPDCTWNRAECIRRLRAFRSMAWVQEALEYAAQKNILNTSLRLAREQKYRSLERYCSRKRMRYRFVRWLNRNVWGRRFVAWYSKNKKEIRDAWNRQR